MIAGAIGGFLGWFLQEMLIPHQAIKDVLTGNCITVEMTMGQTRLLIFCVGGLIGLFLGAVDAIVEGRSKRLAEGMAIGAISGVVLGAIGYYIGGIIYGLLGGSDNHQATASIFAYSRQVIARSFGWAFMGIGVGIGASLQTRTSRRILNGAIGGFLGGFAGGFMFEIAASLISVPKAALTAVECQEVGGPGRMIGFVAIGACAGFFIGLMEELLKQAWVKVLAGKNEGKDFILAKPMNLLGRDERRTSASHRFADRQRVSRYAAGVIPDRVTSRVGRSVVRWDAYGRNRLRGLAQG